MPSKTQGAAALAATLAVAAPSTALAQPGGGHGGRDGNVPTRVASKLRSAERALDRAGQNADDGNADAAVASLNRVRRGLDSALKAGKRRIVAGNAQGAPSAGAIARTDDHVVDGTVDLLDGATDPLVTGSTTTLAAALDNRDAVVTAIAALEDKSGYSRTVSRIAKDVTGEAEAIDDALADDELTDAAKTALTAAKARLTATAAAVKALGATTTADTPTGAQGQVQGAQQQGGRDCPPRGGQQNQAGSQPQSDQAAPQQPAGQAPAAAGGARRG